MQTLRKVYNTPSKKFFEAVWLFYILPGVHVLKIIMSTHLKKKFIESFRLITKIFLDANSKKNPKYTFEKIIWSRLAILNLFQGVYFENSHEYTF